MSYKILIPLYLLFSFEVIAGSCCSGGGGRAQIMLGDTEKVYRLSFFDRTILADKGEGRDIYVRKNSELESIRSIRISSSARFLENWQYGFLVKGMSKTKEIQGKRVSSTGIGDSEFNVAYEFMPEISRSSFLSQGFIYSKINLPTGKSIFTTKRTDTLDTFGTGHYLFSVGTIFTKRYTFGMTTFISGISYRPSRTFKNSIFSENEISTTSSINYDLSLSQSVDLTNLFSMEMGLSRTVASNSTISVFAGDERRTVLNSLSINGSFNTESNIFSISYVDELLIGGNIGSVLGRSIELSIIKKVNL